MGREILFRGKSKKTGNWVWGSLIKNGQYDFSIYDCNEHSDYDLNPGSPHEESFDVIGNIHEHSNLLTPAARTA